MDNKFFSKKMRKCPEFEVYLCTTKKSGYSARCDFGLIGDNSLSLG